MQHLIRFFKMLKANFLRFTVCLVLLWCATYGAYLAGAGIGRWTIVLSVFFAVFMTAFVALFENKNE